MISKIIVICVLCIALTMSGCIDSDGTLDVESIVNDNIDIEGIDITLVESDDGQKPTVNVAFDTAKPEYGVMPINLMITSGPGMSPGERVMITLNDDGSSSVCGGDNVDDCMDGTWKLSNGRYYLIGFGLDDILYVIINEDGTGKQSCMGEDNHGTWLDSVDTPKPEPEVEPAVESAGMPITLVIVSGPNLKAGDRISITLDKDGAVDICYAPDDCRAGTWELSNGQYNLIGFGIDGKIHVIINDDGTGILSSMGVKWNGAWQEGANSELARPSSTGPTILRYLTTATYREYGSDDWQISGMESYYYEEETPYTTSAWNRGPESIEYILNEVGINYVSIETVSEGPNDLSSDSKWIKGEYKVHLMNGGYYKLNCDRAWSRY